MHDTILVRIRKSRCNLAKNSNRFRDRELAVRESRTQGFTLHEWHCEIRKTAGLARRKQRHDVRMLQLRCKLNLSAESVDAHCRRHFGRKNLYDNFSAE